jgi:hypothetical protein
MDAIKYAVAILALFAIVGLVSADQVPTNAQMSGCSNAPWVEEKFELDDDGDPTHTTPGTQVLPVAGGDKVVDIYVVACDQNGQDDIQMVHVGVAFPNQDSHESDAVKITGTEVTTVLQAAVDADLISQARMDELINNITSDNLCNLYREQVTLDNCDPAGMYLVTAVACDNCGAASVPYENMFEYLSIVAVDIDFTSLNYGLISVGIEKKIAGDIIMDPLGIAPPVKPTVQNLGNDPMYVKIAASDMTADCGGGLTGTIPANAQSAMVDSGPKKSLSNAGKNFQEVCMGCEDPQLIDFFVTPPTGTCAGQYSGTVTVTGHHC